MKNKEIEIRCVAAPWHTGVDFIIRKENHIVPDLTFTRVEEGQVTNPTFTLKYKEAQILMDDLWHTGIRPSENQHNSETLSALKQHLNDMRRLVFEKK